MANTQTPPANEPREPVTLTLEGVPYILRPTYDAILAIEAATGKSAFQIARDAADTSLSVTDAGIVSTELIAVEGRASGDKAVASVGRARISQMVLSEGLIAAQMRLAIVMTGAVTGVYTATGDMKERDVPVAVLED